MKVNTKVDYGNDPKKELVKDLTICFSSYEIQSAMQYLIDDFTWNLVGEEPVAGREQFKSALEYMMGNKAVELTIDTIISHENEAAIRGEMKMEDGNVFGFADFYEFSSDKDLKVKSITSFVLQTS